MLIDDPNRLARPELKYTPLRRFHNPNRQWPDKALTKPPIWLSTDLRDGNQSLVNPMTLEQKWDFFQMLVAIGYTELEVCFPAASQVEFNFTRRLVETPGAVPDGVRLRGLSPTRRDFLARTVAALRGAKTASVCTYICISDKQLKYQGFTRQQAVDQAVDSVRFLRSITKDDPEAAAETKWSMAFGLESFNEADLDFATLITEAVKDAWEPTAEEPMVAVIASSTEVATPNVFADQVELFKRSLSEPEKVLISIHTHNDRSGAVASAELGMLAGADMVEGCLFSNGERCGNADLVTLALNLYSRGVSPGLDFSRLPEVKKKFEEFTGLTVPQRAPYAGEFALQAFSGSHQNIIRKGIARRVEAAQAGENILWDIPYLPLDPEDIGLPLDEIIRVNSQSGKAAAAWVLSRRWGLEIPPELQVDFGKRVQGLCEALAREISHREVLDLFVSSYSPTAGAAAGLADARTPAMVVSRVGTRYHVSGTVRPDGSIMIPLDGFGDDIPSAVLAGLPLAQGLHASVPTINHEQPLRSSHLGSGQIGALATCSSDGEVFWGFGVNSNSESAQASAVLAAIMEYTC
ncbi:hypothetical protein KVR01_009165 [Diaporthe batatas]|uniref:uncharacterized protein n=1 Tax=Diaporthe batatas TaxID=748121 RepID=UPI001D039564|nr:uncharacterized protein KVR01_009165 [Diaporthe batatas]KAG8160901.1 hypothetical protein KVR01_009165 [Diaporthe batatas]